MYGVVIVLGAVLAGPSARATAARRWMAPVLDDRAGIAWGVVAGAFLLLVLWGPTHALRTAWGIALLAALLAGGIIALRRQIQREFPSAGQESSAARVSQTAPAAPAGDGGNGGAVPSGT